jgi:hypothetical protein
MNKSLLRKEIFKMIMEQAEQSKDGFVLDKEFAKSALMAFIDGKIDVSKVKVEDNSKMEISQMVDSNDYVSKGYSQQKQTPIIIFEFKGRKMSFVLDVEKEYVYESEAGDWNTPGNETAELVNIEIENQSIHVSDNESGDYEDITKSEIGSSNFKKLEKELKKFIE